MTLVKYPRPMRVFETPEIESLFNNFFNETDDEMVRAFKPATDIIEKENQFELQIILPGMTKKDIAIELDKDKLTISGSRKWEKEENTKYHLRESGYGEFSRTFTLSDTIDRDSVDATFKEGILKITLQKSKESVTKKIDIK